MRWRNVDRTDSYREGVKLRDSYRDSNVLKSLGSRDYLSFVIGGYKYGRSTACMIVGGVEMIIAEDIVFRESGSERRAKVSFLEG